MATGIDLKFTMQDQRHDKWCWAAVGASCALYYDAGSDWTQCKIVNNQLSRPEWNCCDDNPVSNCNVIGMLVKSKPDTGALQLPGVYKSTQEGAVPFGELKAELEAMAPVAFSLKLSLKEGVEGQDQFGHFVVIAGCREVAGKQLVTVYDSIPGSGFAEMTYETFLHDYKCHGKMQAFGVWEEFDQTADLGRWDDKISGYSVTNTYFTKPLTESFQPVHQLIDDSDPAILSKSQPDALTMAKECLAMLKPNALASDLEVFSHKVYHVRLDDLMGEETFSNAQHVSSRYILTDPTRTSGENSTFGLEIRRHELDDENLRYCFQEIQYGETLNEMRVLLSSRRDFPELNGEEEHENSYLRLTAIMVHAIWFRAAERENDYFLALPPYFFGLEKNKLYTTTEFLEIARKAILSFAGDSEPTTS